MSHAAREPASMLHPSKYEILSRLDVVSGRDCYLAVRPGGAGYRKALLLTRIPRRYGADAEFLGEFSAITGLMQRNIAAVFDLSVLSGELHVVNELVTGASLEQIALACRQRGETVPLGLVLKLTRDAATALHYAHQFTTPLGDKRPILHRSLSPASVMLTYAGITKLIDFGLPRKDFGPPSVFQDVRSLAKLLDLGLAEVPREGELPSDLQQLADAVLAYCLDNEESPCTALGFAKVLDEQAGALMWNEEEAASFVGTLFAEQRAFVKELVELKARSEVAPPRIRLVRQAESGTAADARVEVKPIPLVQVVTEAPLVLPTNDFRPLIAAASLVIGCLTMLALGLTHLP